MTDDTKQDQQTYKNTNPYDLVDNQQKKEEKKSPDFMMKLMKKIAKMCGYPDPETWIKEKKAITNETGKAQQETQQKDSTLEQDIKEQEKKSINFESVMSGVSWVIDKIEKKVEEKTWIDFDAPLKRREEKLAQESKKETPSQNTEIATQDETKCKIFKWIITIC